MPPALIRILISLVSTLGFPLLILYVVIRGLRDARYLRSLPERLGALPALWQQTEPASIWLHAVSVGEVISSIPLLKELRQQQAHRKLFVSCTTLAGRAVAEQKLAGLADGIFYAPLDTPWVVRRVLRRLRPALVIVMETEIWPALYREVKRTGASLLIVNGRISMRAIPRYRQFAWLFREVLSWPDLILAQSERDADHYRELLALEHPRVVVTGNLKYDADASNVPVAADLSDYLAACPPGLRWVAASTMPPADPDDVDEDEIVLECFRDLSDLPLLLLLAPRRPERFSTAAALLEQHGIPFTRRSQLPPRPLPLPHVLLLDSLGELSSLFAVVDVVFIGGTLARRGGHNIVEPAQFAKPILTGPHLENFQAIRDAFEVSGALVEVTQGSELSSAVRRLWHDPQARAILGANALRAAEQQRGATARALRYVSGLLACAAPRPARSLIWDSLLRAGAALWCAVSAWRQASALSRQQRLHTPVISIGNLSVGGTGKTPIAAWLAARLQAQGYTAAILTRGYGRRSTADCILPRASEAPVALTGEEAQLFLRRGDAHVGIGAQRVSVGGQVERQLAPDVFLLDDGFQHRQLARDLDLVLMDAQSPWAGGDCIPRGRLREPLSSLDRADAILLTRCHGAEQELTELLARLAPGVPVYRSRFVPQAWVSGSTGERSPVAAFQGRKAAAFCGLGRPAQFWQMLEELGVQVVRRRAFPDHYHYAPAEITHLSEQARAEQAEMLLTTEKDWLNLPAGLAATLPVWWLAIEPEVDEGLWDLLQPLLPNRRSQPT